MFQSSRLARRNQFDFIIKKRFEPHSLPPIRLTKPSNCDRGRKTGLVISYMKIAVTCYLLYGLRTFISEFQPILPVFTSQIQGGFLGCSQDEIIFWVLAQSHMIPDASSLSVIIDGTHKLDTSEYSTRNSQVSHWFMCGQIFFASLPDFKCHAIKRIQLVHKHEPISESIALDSVSETLYPIILQKQFESFVLNPVQSLSSGNDDLRRMLKFSDALSLCLSLNALQAESALVSIIMPTRDRKSKIESSIKSVISQIYHRWELVIVDDGSTDNTYQIVKQFLHDQRIKWYPMGEHVGVSQARTAGVRVSKGELVMYLDSDNQMLPRYVSSMVAGFRIFKEEADALYSGQFILERGNLSSVRFGMLHKYLLYNKNFIDINCLAHTRKSFEKIGGFDKGLDRFVDWDLVLKYAAKNRLKALPIFESKYRINLENSISIDASLEAQMMQMRAKHTSRQSLASRPSHEWIYDHGSFPPLELDEFYSGLRIVIIKTSSVGLLACIKNIMTFVPQPRISVIDIHSTKKKGEHRIAIGGESLTILARNSRREAIAFALSYWGEDVLVLDSNARLLENSLPILAKLAFINHDDQVLVLERIVAGGSDELSQHMPYADPNYSCDVSISSVVSNVRILPTFFLHGVFYLNCLSIFGAFFRKSHSYDLQRALESLPFCEEMQHSEFFQIRHIEAPVLDATNFNGV